MTYFEHHHDNPVIPDIADQAIAARTIAPQAALLALRRFTDLSGILRGHDTFTQKANNGGLGNSVELPDLSFGGSANLNGPGQAAAPALRA